jgi:AcrR family transcriptional regulator
MGLQYHEPVTDSYEQTGRTEQKARTRAALVDATRRLLAAGAEPTVDDVAAAAGISRTTAFRYFPNQRALLLAAHPQIEQRSLLPDDAPRDPTERLDLVLDEFLKITVEWEPQLRASLRLSLEPGAGLPPLRQGRAIGWLEEALAPLRTELPEAEVHRLALAIRSATGIEALVWLTDVAGLARTEATGLMRWSAHALLRAALTDPPRTPAARRPARTARPRRP